MPGEKIIQILEANGFTSSLFNCWANNRDESTSNKKILNAKSEKYKEVEIYEYNGIMVFKKKGHPDNYPQILVRS